MKFTKYTFLMLGVAVLSFGQIDTAEAVSDCTVQSVAGYYCKEKGKKPICPKGCYCVGGYKKATGIDVSTYCAGYGSDTGKYSSSGVHRCPDNFHNSIAGAVSINQCYRTNPLTYYSAANANTTGNEDCDIQSVAGYYCLKHGVKPICPKGCYCVGGYKKATGVSDSDTIKKYCNRTTSANDPDDKYNSSGIRRCPADYPNSVDGAVSINMCHKTNPLAYYGAQTGIDCPKTQDPGKFCKNILVPPLEMVPTPISEECRPGCYCEGGTKKNVGMLNVKKICENHEATNSEAVTLNGAKVFLCPSSHPNSDAKADSKYKCYYVSGNSKVYYTDPVASSSGNYAIGTLQMVSGVNLDALQNAINNSNETTANTDEIIVDPGFYLLANRTEPVACTGVRKYCPGGVFTKKTVEQGRHDCPYGANATEDHTGCKLMLTKQQLKEGITGSGKCWTKTDPEDFTYCVYGKRQESSERLPEINANPRGPAVYKVPASNMTVSKMPVQTQAVNESVSKSSGGTTVSTQVPGTR